MSNTIAHRPHVHHVHWMPTVLLVIVAIAIAAAVIYAVNQPGTATVTTTEAVTPVTTQVLPVEASAADSPYRHAMALWYARHPGQMRLHLQALQRHLRLDGITTQVYLPARDYAQQPMPR